MSKIADRIEAAIKESGRSIRETSIHAGLSPTQLSTMLRRFRQNPGSTVELATLRKVARAVGIPLEELTAMTSTTEGDVATNDAASPVPPPVSDTYVMSDAMGELVNAAFDHRVHMASDVPPVIAVLEKTAALMGSHMSQEAYARYLLDAQADARAKGKRLTLEELPFAALGVSHRSRLALQAAVDANVREAERGLSAEGMALPPMDTVHPAVKKAMDTAAKKARKLPCGYPTRTPTPWWSRRWSPCNWTARTFVVRGRCSVCSPSESSPLCRDQPTDNLTSGNSAYW